jgi:hypothetical protein
VGLESQLASSKLVLRPVARSARRWEMGMKEVEIKIDNALVFRAKVRGAPAAA